MKIKYREALALLQNLINFKPTHTDVSKILNRAGISVTANALANRLANDGYLKDTEVAALEESYAIKLENSNNYITLNYYPEAIASCGNGTFEMSQECVPYKVPTDILPVKNSQKLSMCHAKGNSMFPKIWDGDFVIIEHEEENRIKNGEMYIFCYDNQLYLKRLTKNINQIVVESENPDFPTQYIEREDMNRVYLIGRVICSGRMYGKCLDKRK